MTDRTNSPSPAERLAITRAELQDIFEPQRERSANAGSEAAEGFPRSAIFKLLGKGGKAGALGIAGIALLAMRPSVAAKLLRFLPMGAITKIVVARLINRGHRGAAH